MFAARINMKSIIIFILCCAYLAKAEAGKLTIKNSSRLEEIDPAGLVVIGTKQYYISPTTGVFNFMESMAFCTDIGMSLLSLETEAETLLIIDHLDNNGLRGVFYWTSGRRVADTWQWTGSGQLFSFSDWNQPSRQPDYTGEGDPCVIFDSTNGWFDYACTHISQAHFICETNKEN